MSLRPHFPDPLKLHELLNPGATAHKAGPTLEERVAALERAGLAIPGPGVAAGAVPAKNASGVGGVAWRNPYYCRVYNTSTTVLAMGAAGANLYGPILFPSEDFDVGGLHSTVSNTGRITFPVAGAWEVGWNLPFQASAGYTGGSDVATHLVRNGTWSGGIQTGGTNELVTNHEIPAGGTAIQPWDTKSTIIDAAANDYVELGFRCAETSLAVVSAAGVGLYCNFWAKYLGPV